MIQKIIALLCFSIVTITVQAQDFIIKTKKDKAGVVTSEGKKVLPFEYDEIKFSDTYGLFIVKLGDKYGIVDQDNQPHIAVLFDKIQPTHQKKVFILTMNNKYTLRNLNEKSLLPQVYDYLEEYEDRGWYLAKQANKYGVINLAGEELIPIEYQEVVAYPENNLLRVKFDGKYGLIDMEKQKVLLSFLYDKLTSYSGSSLFLISLNKLQGVWDATTQESVIPVVFDQVAKMSYYEDLFIVEKNKKQGLFNLAGTRILPVEFNNIVVTGIKDKRYYFVTLDDKKGVYNESGELVVPLEYTSLSRHKGTELLIAQKNNKYGLIDVNGKAIVPLKYEDYIATDDDNVLIVKQEDKYGMIDVEGNELQPLVYNHLDQCTSRSYRVEQNNQYGIINLAAPTKLEHYTDRLTASQQCPLIDGQAEVALASVTPKTTQEEPTIITEPVLQQPAVTLPPTTEEPVIVIVPPIDKPKQEDNLIDIQYEVDEEPKYPGGIAALRKFVSQEVSYSQKTIQNAKKGDVIIKFIIKEDGSLYNPIIVSNESGKEVGEAVVKALEKSKDWEPAKLESKKVNTFQTFLYPYTPYKEETAIASVETPKIITETPGVSTPAKGIIYSTSGIDKEAQYPGGMAALDQFVEKNITYPAGVSQANRNAEIMLKFIVETDGTVSTPLVVVDRVGSGAGEQVVEALKKTKDWKPAEVNKQPVRSYYRYLYQKKEK